MHMSAPRNDTDHTPDVLPVLDRGVTFREVAEGDLVTDRNIIERGDAKFRIVLRNHGEKIVTGRDAFHNDHTDIVPPVVDEELWFPHGILPRKSNCICCLAASGQTCRAAVQASPM